MMSGRFTEHRDLAGHDGRGSIAAMIERDSFSQREKVASRSEVG
jgi:hypothetical protein